MFNYDPIAQGVSESLGVDLTNSRGTAVTPNATINTKGSWVSLGTSTFAYEQICLMAGGTAAASTGVFYACDIGIYDGSADYTPILSNWIMTGTSAQPGAIYVPLPIHVKSGAQLGARVQCGAAAGAALYLSVFGVSVDHGGAPGYSRGFNLVAPVSSGGVVINSGTPAHTRLRTVLVASTLERAEAVMVVTRPGSAARAQIFDLEVGSAGNEAPIIKDFMQMTYSANLYCPSPVIRRSIPAASRLTMNVQSSTGTSSQNSMPYGFA